MLSTQQVKSQWNTLDWLIDPRTRHIQLLCFAEMVAVHEIWVSYNISLTWIKAIWGWFPLLTMISSEVKIAIKKHTCHLLHLCWVRCQAAADPSLRDIPEMGNFYIAMENHHV